MDYFQIAGYIISLTVFGRAVKTSISLKKKNNNNSPFNNIRSTEFNEDVKQKLTNEVLNTFGELFGILFKTLNYRFSYDMFITLTKIEENLNGVYDYLGSSFCKIRSNIPSKEFPYIEVLADFHPIALDFIKKIEELKQLSQLSEEDFILTFEDTEIFLPDMQRLAKQLEIVHTNISY